jgi:glutathione S-transferase
MGYVALTAIMPFCRRLRQRRLWPSAAVLDAHLAERRWISGTSVTLADLSIAATYACAAPGKAPVAWYANLQKWFAHMQTLAVWRKSEQLARAA